MNDLFSTFRPHRPMYPPAARAIEWVSQPTAAATTSICTAYTVAPNSNESIVDFLHPASIGAAASPRLTKPNFPSPLSYQKPYPTIILVLVTSISNQNPKLVSPRPNSNQECRIPPNNNWLCFNKNLQLLEPLHTHQVLAFRPTCQCISRIR